MTESLDRRAFVIDRKGNAGSQGIFPGKEFDHLIGKSIEMERKPLRELTLWTIYNTLVEEMSDPDSREINDKELSQLMSIALTEPRYSRGKGSIKLEGKIVIPQIYEEVVLANIYSGPRKDGIRIELLEEEPKIIVIDLTRKDTEIRIKTSPEEVFRVMGLSEFLEDNYDPEEAGTEYKQEHVAAGRELDDLIFWQKPELRGGENN